MQRNSTRRSFAAAVLLLSSVALAEPLFPPGTTYDLPANDPITDKVEDIVLWPKAAPGSEKVTIEEKIVVSTVNPSRNVHNVTKPMMQAFVAAKPKGVAVLVVPGGGYTSVVWDTGGVEIARWLNGIGVDAYVLKYRLPNDGHKDGVIVPLQDGQRALRLIRKRQPSAKVGALGFSAGGHLAGVVGTSSKNYYDAVDGTDSLPARPDFLVLIYPPKGGPGAWAANENRVRLIAGHSIVEGINSNTPPTFLVHGEKDSKVPASHSETIYAALQKANVKSELHIYPGAEHGFGLRAKGPEKEWPNHCASWLQTIGMLPPT